MLRRWVRIANSEDALALWWISFDLLENKSDMPEMGRRGQFNSELSCHELKRKMNRGVPVFHRRSRLFSWPPPTPPSHAL